MFTRILVPTDFSPGADAALNYARVIADKFGASLQLLHVMDDPVNSIMMSVDSLVPDVPELREAMFREAAKLLDGKLTADDRTKLHASGEAIFGADARSIVDYATTHSIDLIVMGTHGRTGMSHLLMGSVAEHVVRTAPCAVLTVREGAARTQAQAA
jgi:nucleotide-binding universal stress UspA family protein